MFLARAAVILSVVICTSSKIYQRCELARELRNFDIPEHELATWVCIARYESNFDTAAMNHGSGDHGLFQISEIYWCSPPGYGCNTACSSFRDDDISDDLRCIRRIHNEHKRLSGDGFNAWVVYPMYCKGDTASYIQDCFDEDLGPDNVTDNEISTEDTDEDGYNFPPLPTYNRNGDGYDFPQLPVGESSIQQLDENPFLRSLKIFKSKPYSKTSIHHSVAVNTKEPTGVVEAEPYNPFLKNLAKFPYSRTSIHESKSGNPFFNDQFNKLPYSMTSIHETSLKRFEFPKFPHVHESINYFKPAPEKIDFATLPFSKQSINYFVPVYNEYKTTIRPATDDEDTTISNDVSNEITKFTKAVPFTLKPVTSTTTGTKKSFFQQRLGVKVESTSTLKPFTTKKLDVASNQDTTTNTFDSSYTTSSPSTFFTFKPFTTKIPSTTFEPFTTKKINLDTTKVTPSTSFTFKPFSRKAQTPEPFVSKSSVVPSQSFTTKTLPSTTFKFKQFSFKALESGSSTNKPETTTSFGFKQSFSFKPFNTTFKPFTTTTQSPQSRQLTFAPDSFFSWIFQSQTLPPLVPPVRPSRFNTTRPMGPGLPPLPPPPRPVRPNISNSTRPRPPGLPPFRPLDGNSTRRPFSRPPRPQGDGDRVPLNRPRLTTTTLAPTVTTMSGKITEYKLGENVTLVKSRYGFRFFRN